MKSKLSKEERFELIKRALKGEKIAQLCKEAGISRVLFYRWLKRYEEEGKRKLSPLKTGRPRKLPEAESIHYTRLSPHDRELMIKEVVEQGSDVSEIAEKYGISRVTFYKWLNRYNKASQEEKDTALLPKERHIDRYFRQTPEKHEESLLSLVAQHPEYGIRSLINHLPKVGGIPLIGHHGVQNILNRHNLATYELRLAYAQGQITPVTRSIEGILDKVSGFFRIAPDARHDYIRSAGIIALTTFFTVVLFGLGSMIVRSFNGGVISSPIGMFFAFVALFMGSIFFLYSLKYYLTMAIVLSFSQKEGVKGQPIDPLQKKNWLSWILGINRREESQGIKGPVGLEPNLDHVSLVKHPYVSVQIPFYNEKYVVERAIEAATNFDYPEYEVILCDDSTDETTEIIREYQKRYLRKGESLKETKGEGWELTQIDVRPGVTLKHLHRTSRSGFKGGALNLALKLVNPKTEFISIFDADFVPYPDTISLFLKYFKVQNNGSEDYTKSDVAAVQGYQWHVLNKSENWITRGVRSEYSGSYVIERSGTEIYGGLKQISGSVYMIRRKPLEEVGWGVSITEDFELTLKLYNKGYRVVYTPYIQAPAECVSTIKRLVRQRMRWAEGHSQNIKKMFKTILFNPKLTWAEKFEFAYLSPYYLQAFFFLVGTLSWLLSETVFPARLPFWTSLWGWSLVLTNMFALPLMNAVGMFLEESEEKDYLGLASFVALSYLLVPFQAYASVKGFLEKEEGPWFRTPKTGKITDIFARGKFYRFISGILSKGSFTPEAQHEISPYLALVTANSHFNKFAVKRNKNKWLGKLTLSILLMITLTTYFATKGVPEVFATNPSTTQYMGSSTTSTYAGAWTYQEIVGTQNTTTRLGLTKNQIGTDKYAAGQQLAFSSTTKCGSPTGEGWILDIPFGPDGGDERSIASGTWTFNIYETDNFTAGVGHLDVCVWDISVNGSGGLSSSSLLFESQGDASWATTDIINGLGGIQTRTTSSESKFLFDHNHYIYVEYWLDMTTKHNVTGATYYTYLYTGECGATDPGVITPTISIPENVIFLVALTPLIPFMVAWLKERKEKMLALELHK